MVSTLGNAVQFLQDFGLFDVILPFLLVFTLVFAVLEKTKIFGVEGDNKSRKNLNAMASFAIAFFVTASVNVVSAFQFALPWVSLILVVLVSFLLLSGVFFEETADGKIWSLFSKHPSLTKWLVGIVGLAILVIFLSAFGLMNTFFTFFQSGGENTTLISSLIFLLLLIAAMWYATKPNKPTESGDKPKAKTT